jgi:hypothetical protein
MFEMFRKYFLSKSGCIANKERGARRIP